MKSASTLLTAALATVLAIGLLPTCEAARLQYHTITGKVTKVVDGDSIWVQSGRTNVQVRLDRIDAPEYGQPWGVESMRYLYGLVFRKTVVVKYAKNDPHGRLLGLVSLDGEDINLKLVKTGNAWHYAHFDRTTAYREAEKQARERQIGLWSKAGPIKPFEWRKLHPHGSQVDESPW